MKQSNTRYAITYGIRLVAFIIAIAVGKEILGHDFGSFMSWWLTLLAITVTFYPVIGIIFKRFHDGGWIFCKMIGLALAGYCMWLLSSVHILKFNHINTVLTLGICLIINLLIVGILYYRKNKVNQQTTSPVTSKNGSKKLLLNEFYDFNLDKLKSMLTVEVMFFILFLLWTMIRGFRPEVSNTESPMDYGFMAAMMRADYMPAEDIWMAGKAINYYYVGQYFATYLTKLSNVTVNVGYNLALMTVAGGAFTLAYSLVYNITKTFTHDCRLRKRVTGRELLQIPMKKITTVWCVISGLLAGLSVTFAGNMHYVIYNFIKPEIAEKLGKEIKSYWWPNSTRYIGYDPEIANDKTIHEFPAYSFILGDLHAHVFNIIFVMSVLGLLFAFLQYRKAKMDDLRLGVSIKRPDFKKEAFHPIILLLGFFIGLFHMTNYWDFPIYYVVCGAIILFSNLVIYQFSLDAIKLTAVHAVVIMGLSKIVALPFTLNFDQISSNICIATHHSLLHQLLILWGLPTIIVAYYVIARYRDLRFEGYITIKGQDYYKKKAAKPKKNKIISQNSDHTMIAFAGEKNKLFQFIEHLSIADLFIVTIGLCAIGLIILPEVIYVEDIYPSYSRANTMFKLTYQGYIMFGLCMGYILIRAFRYARFWRRRFVACIGIFLLVWTSFYSVTAVKMWQGGGSSLKMEKYKNLDSIAFMKDRCLDDYNAILWFNENVNGTKVITEGYGASYSNFNRISAYTGLPTIIGWQTHEHLWRSGALGGFPPEVTERNEDVTKIYTSTDTNEILACLKKYDVDYIYLGSMENEQFNSVNNEILKGLGEVVFDSPADDTKNFETVIIQVNKELYDTVVVEDVMDE